MIFVKLSSPLVASAPGALPGTKSALLQGEGNARLLHTGMIQGDPTGSPNSEKRPKSQVGCHSDAPSLSEHLDCIPQVSDNVAIRSLHDLSILNTIPQPYYQNCPSRWYIGSCRVFGIHRSFSNESLCTLCIPYLSFNRFGVPLVKELSKSPHQAPWSFTTS